MLSAPRRGHRRERAARCAFGFDAGSGALADSRHGEGDDHRRRQRRVHPQHPRRPLRVPRAARHARDRAARHRRRTARATRNAQRASWSSGSAPATASPRTPTGAPAFDGADYLDQRDPGRRVRGDPHRLRDPEEVRAPPDDRRHDRHRRHHARPPHDPRDGRDGRRDGRALPRRAPAQLHEPDGDGAVGGLGRVEPSRPPTSSACATASATRTRSSRRRSAFPRTTVAFLTAGFNHQCFVYVFRDRETGEDLYPRLREIVDADPEGLGRRVRVELFRRFGYFPTECVRAFERVRAVVPAP